MDELAEAQISRAVADKRAMPWAWPWFVLAVTALGGALRFALLDDKTLWVDEAFSLWMARHEPPDLLQWLVRIDHHPPLYYLLLHYWITAFGESEGALRSLSALSSTLVVPLFAIAARRFTGAWVGGVAVVLLAISPFQVRYAQEARMYALLTLCFCLVFVALAHLLVVRGSDQPQRGRQWWWLLLAVGEAAAMLTHNTATVLVPLALNGAILLARFDAPNQPGFRSAWLLSQLSALLLWSPWAWAFVQQARVVENHFWIAAPQLWDVWLALGSFSFAYLPAWIPQRDYLAWLALTIVALGVWQWRREVRLTWILGALWLLPPTVELIASIRTPIFYDRTLIWTMLPYHLLVARGLVLLSARRIGWKQGWFALAVAAMSTLCALGVWSYTTDFEKEAWDEVAIHVADRSRPHALILFHASWAELPWNYYYPQDAPRLAQHGVPADLFDAGTVEPPMTEADVPRVRELIAGREEVWLVYSHWWYTDPQGLLPAALDEQLHAVDERAWPGIRVIKYQAGRGD